MKKTRSFLSATLLLAVLAIPSIAGETNTPGKTDPPPPPPSESTTTTSPSLLTAIILVITDLVVKR